MDALVKEALARVNECVGNINQSVFGGENEAAIAKAIHAVDALKSSLKTVDPSKIDPEVQRKHDENYQRTCDAMRETSQKLSAIGQGIRINHP